MKTKLFALSALILLTANCGGNSSLPSLQDALQTCLKSTGCDTDQCNSIATNPPGTSKGKPVSQACQNATNAALLICYSQNCNNPIKDIQCLVGYGDQLVSAGCP